MTKEQVAYNGLEQLENQIKEGCYINIALGSVKATAIVRLKHARNAIQDLTNEVERLNGQIEALSERVEIMQEGADGWHFSGTPEIPAGKNQVTVIVWTGSGNPYPLIYCKHKVRGKEVYRFEFMNGSICHTLYIKAWRYMPKPPEGVE